MIAKIAVGLTLVLILPFLIVGSWIAAAILLSPWERQLERYAPNSDIRFLAIIVPIAEIGAIIAAALEVTRRREVKAPRATFGEIEKKVQQVFLRNAKSVMEVERYRGNPR